MDIATESMEVELEPVLIPKTVTVRVIDVLLDGGLLIPFTLWPDDSFSDDGEWLYVVQNGETFEVQRSKVVYIRERQTQQPERPDGATLSQELIDAFNGVKTPRQH